MYRCQPRRDQISRRDIIEADDSKILRNSELIAPRSLNNAYCQPITPGQDGGWSRFASKDPFRGSSTAFFVGTGAFPNHHRKPGSTGIENFKVAFDPAPGYFETDTFQTFSVDKTAVSANWSVTIAKF